MRFKTSAMLCLLFSTVYGQSESPDTMIDKVYAKAISYDEDSTYTCHVRSRMQKTDKNWQADETTVIEKKMVRNGRDVSWDILNAVVIKKNKETDITAEVRKEMEKETAESGENGSQGTSEEGGEEDEKREISLGQDDFVPFSPERRPLFHITQIADTVESGISWQRLKTDAKSPDENIYEGVYWIHPGTWVIRRVVLQPSKNPKFVKSLILDFSLSEKPGNRYTLDRFSSKVYVDLMLKKIRILSEEVYSDYVFE